MSPEELKNYCNKEIELMKKYIEDKRALGDKRDKQEIVAEWIKYHAEEFRENNRK